MTDPVPPRHDPRQSWRTEGMPGGSSPSPNGWRSRGGCLVQLLVLLVVYAAFGFLYSDVRGDGTTSVDYTAFTAQLDAGNVKSVYSRGSEIQGTLKKPGEVPGGGKGDTYTHFKTYKPAFADDGQLWAEITRQKVAVAAEPLAQGPGLGETLLVSLLPTVLLIAVWVFVARRTGGGLGGLGGAGGVLGRKPPKPVGLEPGERRTTFADVAGIDEVEGELNDVVAFLKNPGVYRRLGAKMPRGVLLAGPPGTGKTLLARAVAGEAGVPFFSASASEFIEMIVGVGASRVRELFAEARKVAPSIVFIDEIDTIGRSRGGSSVGGHDEREQTLNQILTEMDGFSGSEGVIVIAATNRVDVLDAALTRPGRFDRVVQVSPPDRAGREAILRIHTRAIPLAADVDLAQVARTTPGMTGAELANLANEAALLAVKYGQDRVTRKNLSEALEKVQLGAERPLVMPREERRRTAYHESGHALLGMLQPGADPVRKVTIVPRGRALGVTLSTPDADKYAYTEEYLRGRIIGALGGMAAEQVVFGVVTTGAENDLEQVTGIARGMVSRWGMSEKVGRLSALPGDTQQPYGLAAAPRTLDVIDAEMRRIVEECYEEACRTLREHRDRLDALAVALLEHETLEEPDAYRIAGLPPRDAGGGR
ncbi:ATP-dependent zinc metalloprotease FtsH [Streptomyces sp. NPDC052721]|uniref:ATP-dependent zinc metalloprotease FtsH n=1 Tax=Streptomyces sp. NPDC052721 TaxID=3154955 RepID=UPI0034498C6B